MKRATVAFFLTLLTLFSSLPSEGAVRILARVTGTVASRKDAEERWKPLFATREVESSDWARTRTSSMAKLFFGDRMSFVKIYENTEVQIKEVQEPGKGRKIELNQSIGRLRATVRKFLGEKQNVEIRTPTAVLAVEGTSAGSLVLPDLTTIFGIYSGWGRVFAGGKSLLMAPGDSAVVHPGGSPTFLPHGSEVVYDASGNLYDYEDSPSDEETGGDVESESLVDDTATDQQYDTPQDEASLGNEAPVESAATTGAEPSSTADAAPVVGTGTGSETNPAPTVSGTSVLLSGSLSGTFAPAPESHFMHLPNPPPAGVVTNADSISPLPPPPPALWGSSGTFTNTVFDMTDAHMTLSDTSSTTVFSGTVTSGTITGSGTWVTFLEGGTGEPTIGFTLSSPASLLVDAVGSSNQAVSSDPAFTGFVFFDNQLNLSNMKAGGNFSGSVNATPIFRVMSVQSH